MRKYLIVSLLIAIAIMPLMYSLYKMLYVVPFVETHFSTENYDRFLQTWYGLATIAVWIVIGSSWVIMGLRRLYSWHTPAISIITLILLLAIFNISVPVVAASWKLNWNNVDVIAMADEEFRAHPEWIDNAEQTLETVNQERFARFQIEFQIRGWFDWDSDDDATKLVYLHQEAIKECGLPIAWIELDPEGVPGFYGWGFVDQSQWTDTDGNV